jgi:hypothetical protein
MTAAKPDAASVWPIFVLTLPTQSGCTGPSPFSLGFPLLFLPIASPMARASMGSPTLVPVPCASSTAVSRGSSPARA